MKGKQINSFINNSYEVFCSRNIQNCFEEESYRSRFLLSNNLFFNLSRFFSYLLKTFEGNLFLNLYFHIWVLDFVSIVENLESCRFVVCC